MISSVECRYRDGVSLAQRKRVRRTLQLNAFQHCHEPASGAQSFFQAYYLQHIQWPRLSRLVRRATRLPSDFQPCGQLMPCSIELKLALGKLDASQTPHIFSCGITNLPPVARNSLLQLRHRLLGDPLPHNHF